MKFSLQLALFFLVLSGPARAHKVETGTGMICNTQQQAERLARILDGNEQTAVSAVNGEERDPIACAVGSVAYVRGATLGTARNKSGAFQIVEILVVGVVGKSGIRSAAPGVYVLLFKIDERIA